MNLGQCTEPCTVNILRTPCCPQVTKPKYSYLYQKSRSPVTRWRAGDWVTSTELNVPTSDYGKNNMFSRHLSIPSTPSCHCRMYVWTQVLVLEHRYMFATEGFLFNFSSKLVCMIHWEHNTITSKWYNQAENDSICVQLTTIENGREGDQVTNTMFFNTD